MAVPATPTNFNVTQGNRQINLVCDLTPTATSYTFQRSTDGVTFTPLGTPSTPNFLDTTPVVGTMYWYNVFATNGSGNSAVTASMQMVACPAAEMSLYELRLRAKQAADRVNSNFLTISEWNMHVVNSMYELYDLLITVYEDYFVAPEVNFTATGGNNYLYPLPDGVTTFKDSNGNNIVAAPFYKLEGVDLSINNANNAFVTIGKYNLIDRNKFIYPNSSSTIYGVFNLRYRLYGNNLRFTPTPSAGQIIRLLYTPRLPQLLQDTDISTLGFSGWLEYVIIDVAIKALRKEESDVSTLMAQKNEMRKRIEDSAPNRDAGMPDTISDSRQWPWGGGPGQGGWNGFPGGF